MNLNRELSEDSRALLDSAADCEDPTPEDRTRVRAGIARRIAVGVGGAIIAKAGTAAESLASAAGYTSAGSGITAAATTGTPVLGALAVTGTGTKIWAAIAFVSAISAAGISYTDRGRDVSSSVNLGGGDAAPSLVAQPPVPVAREEESKPLAYPCAVYRPVSAPPSSVTREAEHSSRDVPRRIVHRNTGTGGGVSSDVAAEVELLREAHAALRKSDGARALIVLAAYSRRFPNGSLVEEGEAARIQALCSVGHFDLATDAANRFIREYPRSPQVSWVALGCSHESKL